MAGWAGSWLTSLTETAIYSGEVLLAVAVVVPGYLLKKSAELVLTATKRLGHASCTAGDLARVVARGATHTAAFLFWSGAAFGVLALDRSFLVAFNTIEVGTQVAWFVFRALPEAATDLLSGVTNSLCDGWAATKRLVRGTVLSILYRAMSYLNYHMPTAITPVEVDEVGKPVAPYEYCCPISGELMRDPVILLTGHSYELESIAQWLERGHNTCPMTNQQLHWRINSQVFAVRNHALRSLIDAWVRAHCGGLDPRRKHGLRASATTPANETVVCFRRTER